MAEHNQQFDSFEEWVNKASSWLTRHQLYDGKNFRAICFDAKGRLCQIGKDFTLARDEGAFPVKWMWPDQVAKYLASTPKDLWAPIINKLNKELRDGS